LGATATQNYTVVGTAAVFFRITLPEGESVSWETTASGAVAITESNQIAFSDNDPNEDTITRSDGGSFATDGFAAGDRIMVGGSTSNDGIYEIATVAAGTLTLIETDALITEAAGASVTVTNGVLVRVEAPDPTTSVRFASTFGVWDNTGSSVIEKAVAGDFASAVFTSPVAGLATIHVSDQDDPTLYDQLDVVVSAPSADSAYIMLQSNTYVVPPSTGGISQEAILTASVRTSVASGRQPVGGAAVAFSVKNQTGGGEKVFPVVVFTDDSGVATTTFSSGSLSSGADGVTVSARVLGKGQTGPLNTISFHAGSPATITRSDLDSFMVDGFEVGEQILVEGSARNDGNYILSAITANTLTLAEGEVLADEAAGGSVTLTALATSVNIVIGGTAGSIVIGSGSKIEVLSPTTYSLPMSVLVSDSNGNPVSGAKVSLGAWPSFYSTGGWQHLEETTIDPTTGIMVTTQLEECEAVITGTYANEDLNENLFLDPGEDSGPDPGHGDGQLTPPNSAAGNVPMSVTTDDNGVANFSLVYMKSSAVWIVDRIRASTLVLGTETTSSTTFRLPAEESEAEACDLPNSPYNRPAEVLDVDSVALSATPNNMTADGSSKSAIIALVTDKNGNAVDGELI
ncbi:MAG: hypothetical protein SWE60_25655, partial [Thermodesulfobacteriota bacterium]|nr:hypothetical protein [Thermodesulfobacteriota bacterium]